ncbi:MAG TPA: glycine cleavage T C-terminal barrel domain-containing protein [Candidatus Acidoferrales bacterium]|jgi:folate-binding protein YgfZ|nr:glycine cleavage T C-terminal barrel domain-containing protein [Candidatus Acidoferrales bacterium]
MPLETPLLEMHKSAGATIGEYFGTQLPASFGKFAAEYKSLRETVGLVDTNYRAYFSFTGPDRQRYVNAILTSNVRDLKPGQGAVGLLLNPQGHILAEVETLLFESNLLASCHAMIRERTFATFDKFIIMDDVTLEDITPSTGTLDLVGPRTVSLLEKLGVPAFKDMHVLAHSELSVGTIPCRVERREIGGNAAATIITNRDKLPTLWNELAELVHAEGGAPAGMDALNSVRLECGIAWFGHDFDDKQIPHEAGLEHSHISYEKGCYTGQEIVERVRSRGHANRRLAELRFFSDLPPGAGTKLLFAGNEVGSVTSSGSSPLLGQPIGLGYLRREQSAFGTSLDACGIAAEVITPPFSQKKHPPENTSI